MATMTANLIALAERAADDHGPAIAEAYLDGSDHLFCVGLDGKAEILDAVTPPEWAILSARLDPFTAPITDAIVRGLLASAATYRPALGEFLDTPRLWECHLGEAFYTGRTPADALAALLDALLAQAEARVCQDPEQPANSDAPQTSQHTEASDTQQPAV
jgi:hypothetical protein